MGTETRQTWCGLCHNRCGLEVDVVDGRAVALRGDRAHPVNEGRTCERGRLLLEHLYHPDRLNHPLKRVGERGSGTWERVSWDRALDDIAERLAAQRKEHGAQTLAHTRGTHRTYHWDARRFLNLFGSPNLTGANPICYCPSLCVESAILGDSPVGDRDRAACLVLWGSARSVSSRVTDWHAIGAAHRRGAKIIVVDPRRTAEADLADLWLPVRPGTDLALLLAWIHVLCEEDLYDHDFVAQWTVGFDDIRDMARGVSPAVAARITGLTEADINRSARLYATTRPGVISWGQGLDKQGPSTDAVIGARSVLRAISGNLDVEGGERLGLSSLASAAVSEEEMECNEALHSEQRALMLGGARHPLFGYGRWERVRDAQQRLEGPAIVKPHATATVVTAHPNAVFGAMLPGAPHRVRSLICQAANPLLTLADPVRTLEALRSLELLVVMDYYQTPTAALADYVLPAASTLERDDLTVTDAGVIAHPRGLDPVGERRSDYELWMELGRRLGQAERWPWDTAAQVCEHRLANTGLTWAELRERRGVFADPPVGRFRTSGFGTPSGKVELNSSVLRDLGCESLPRLEALGASEAERDGDYPLLIITGSSFNPMYHSEGRQWPTARGRCPDPTVTLHPDTAAFHAIAEGDWVRIDSARGAIRQRAHLSDRLGRGVVDCQHGWWYPERPAGEDPPFGALESNANVLCGDGPSDCARGTGAWRQTGIPGRISRL
jgi:anaerobic selenocysteine-containing dehydrogenase